MLASLRRSLLSTVRDGRTRSSAGALPVRLEALPPDPRSVLGRFHEISLTTADIRESVEFYERLGFTQATTTDTWQHPYGVLTDGRLFLGLHRREAPSPTLTFVRPGLAEHLADFTGRGIDLTVCHTGDEVFNEIAFSDPFGQNVAVLEARTYSPVRRPPSQLSLCGYFSELSLPAADFEAARAFWEPLGFVATDEADAPYHHLPLTSDHLDIAFHRPSTHDVPMIVFTDSDMPARIARLRELGVAMSRDLPRGIAAGSNAVIEAPEGTTLLLLQERN
jgi:catechol 2,3-dioxygenase-like lactoylglutathione lyase family enzyme